MKIFLDKNVYDAALERINFLFDEFPNIVVGLSGGKDSTVVYHLAMQVARERGRLPLPVFFLDQEAEWTSTIEIVRQIMYDPDVKPLWFQMPIYIENATSLDTKYLKCWDPENEAEWLREKEEISIKENVFGTPWFLYLFKPIFQQLYPDQRVAVLSGVRCEESPGRLMGLTGSATYKWITWAAHLTTGQITFYPLYDWSYRDIWAAIHKNKWPYNRLYDLEYQYGTPVQNMRVSNLHHETAVRDLFMLQELDPELYNKLCRRLPGADTAGKMGKDFFVKKLPYMFKDWCEYRDFLIEKLVSSDPEWKKKLLARVAEWDKMFDGSEHKQKAAKIIVSSICSNDFNGAKIDNFRASFVNLYKRHQLDDIPWENNEFHRATNPVIFDLLKKRCERLVSKMYTYKQFRYRIDGDTAYREALR